MSFTAKLISRLNIKKNIIDLKGQFIWQQPHLWGNGSQFWQGALWNIKQQLTFRKGVPCGNAIVLDLPLT